MTTKNTPPIDVPAVEGPRWQSYMPLDDLMNRRDPRNAKLHDDGLGASMERFGYIETVTLDERTGLLISGHGRIERLDAMRGTEKTPPEGIVVNEGGMWFVPTSRGWSSADDDEAEAALIAANQLTVAGGWDIARLHEQLSRQAARPAALAGLGFVSKDIERLKRQIEQASPTEGGGGPQLGNLEYRVIIILDNDQAQRTLSDELQERGYTVQLLIS